MADFIIPKGQDFEFSIRVIEKDSFLAQDLTNMDSAVFRLIDIVTQELVTSVDMTVVDALNGVLKGTIPSTDTAMLSILRGPAEDGYYLKAGYQGSMTITFTDGTESINVLIDKVLVAPTGA